MSIAAKDEKAPVAIWPEGTPKPLMPYSPAVKAGGWLFLSGHLASDYKAGGLATEATPKNPNLENELALQSRYILENMAETAKAGGCDIAKDTVRIWQWLVSEYPTNEEFASGNTWPRIESITPYLDTRNTFIKEPRPASTALGMRTLLVKGTKIEIDLICIDDENESIGYPVPPGVPSPLAGYSPALRRGDWIFLAGDTPADWKGDYGSDIHMGEVGGVSPEARLNPYFWYGSAIERHTDFTLMKLAKIAEAAGSSLARAVKADVYIGDPGDYTGMDKVWKRWFPDNPPARCVIPYMGIGGGKGALIEIALTLLANDSELEIETIATPNAPAPFSHEPQAIKAGNFLFLSQQMACDENGLLPPGMSRNPAYPFYGQPARDQMRFMLKNVAAICEAAGTTLENVVRRVCFHDDGQWFAQSIEEWAAHFPDVKPASTTMVLEGPLVVQGAHTLLDLIAYVPAPARKAKA
ncbi:RidA family protein [Beijerinckia sp. L45]|uniref:RidA family protein n=1 Tax=Beijerinckia sp. L45 TaxID=1641855 RepID=UPI00131D5851|nr:RidA family protein [Beijerinckia sp. L45]